MSILIPIYNNSNVILFEFKLIQSTSINLLTIPWKCWDRIFTTYRIGIMFNEQYNSCIRKILVVLRKSNVASMNRINKLNKLSTLYFRAIYDRTKKENITWKFLKKLFGFTCKIFRCVRINLYRNYSVKQTGISRNPYPILKMLIATHQDLGIYRN